MSDAPLPDLSKPGRTHFVGAGGVGMAGVAFLLRRLGWEVTGCDGSRAPLLDWLSARGVPAVAGHDPAHLEPRPDLVVRTPAVHDDNPELAAARALGVPVVARGDALAALSARYETFAVCGSHGKTTTSTFLATILRAERPADTLRCIGGTSPPRVSSSKTQVSNPDLQPATCNLRPEKRRCRFSSPRPTSPTAHSRGIRRR